MKNLKDFTDPDLQKESINTVADSLVMHATSFGEDIFYVFNDIKLIANVGDNSSMIESFYFNAIKERINEQSKDLPKFTVNNNDTWNYYLSCSPVSFYKGILNHSANWASKMEAMMSENSDLTVVDVARKAMEESDQPGLSGTAFGFSLIVLYNVWKFGDELKIWWDKKG